MRLREAEGFRKTRTPAGEPFKRFGLLLYRLGFAPAWLMRHPYLHTIGIRTTARSSALRASRKATVALIVTVNLISEAEDQNCRPPGFIHQELTNPQSLCSSAGPTWESASAPFLAGMRIGDLLHGLQPARGLSGDGQMLREKNRQVAEQSVPSSFFPNGGVP